MKLYSKAGQEISLELDHAAPVVASDTVDVASVGALIHCNKTGNYNLLLTGMDTPVVMYLIGGVSYPLRIRRLYATNTDNADGLVALMSVYTTEDTE